MDELDVLIKNVSIVDGISEKSYQGSIGIRGEKIIEIGELKKDAIKMKKDRLI